MSNTTYTPGPWRYTQENGSPTTGQHMIAGAKPGYLAEVRDCGSGDVTANARLIASAPDLVAVLRRIVSTNCGCIPVCRCNDESALRIWKETIQDEARAALAKAIQPYKIGQPQTPTRQGGGGNDPYENP